MCELRGDDRGRDDNQRLTENQLNTGIDFSSVGVCARMPSLLHGVRPSELCPVCGSQRIAPESDEGTPPLGEWLYDCEGGYSLPTAAGAPQKWRPYGECEHVSTEQGLAWLREICLAEAELASVGSVIGRAVQTNPPYHAEGESPLYVTLPPVHGAKPSETCPICGDSTNPIYDGLHAYRCGAIYRVKSARPGMNGGMIPRDWVGLHSCQRPPVAAVLRTLRARDEPEWSAVCEEALAALPER